MVLPSIIDTPTNRVALGAENAHNWVKSESLAQVICFLASEVAQDPQVLEAELLEDFTENKNTPFKEELESLVKQLQD